MAIRRISARLFTRSAAVAATALMAVTVLAACGNDDATSSDADAVTISDQWVKAADSGMTAAFGKLHNSSDRDIRVVSAHTDDAGSTEMHEVVDNGTGGTTMRQKDGGFVIPANGEIDLVPGGEHFMLMQLKKPITTGQNVAFSIRFEDGSTMKFDALARDFDGNQENYAPGEHGGDDMPDHSGSHQ